jgi:hypothetical protein
MDFPEPPPAPKMPDPVRIPSPNDPDMIAARKQRQRGYLQSKEGRTETELGEGAAFSRTTLG